MPSSSPPKAVLHIGLAKTATTSLQQHFYPLAPESVTAYIGTMQPRQRFQSPAYAAIMNAVNSPRANLVDSVKLAQAALAEIPSQKSVLFSEEMITVDGPSTWQEKVARLGEIFSGHAPTVLITIREPLSGLFSLYVELFRKVARRYPTFLSFCTSNQAAAYDFRLLTTVVTKAFPTATVTLIPFEELRPGGTFLTKIADVLQFTPPIDHLPRTNNTKRRIGSHVQIPALSLKTAMKQLSHQDRSWLIRAASKAALKILAPANDLTARIPLPWTERRLPHPFPDQKLHRFFDSNVWLLRNHGIDYNSLANSITAAT